MSTKKETSKINKVLFQTTGKGNTTTRVSVPLLWLEEIGITAENRDVKLTKKGKKIILEKAEDTETIK